MSASRRAPLLLALFAPCAASSGCSWTLDLDGYSSRTGVAGAISSLEGNGDAGVSATGDAAFGDTAPNDVAGPFRDYRFPRGAASFSVAAAEGLASMAAPGEAIVLTPGSFPTARGGTVDVAADGGFTFTPAGAPGTFWGTDRLEYPLPASVLRARITVYPDRLRLAELTASGGGGFGIAGAEADDNVGGTGHGVSSAGDVNGDGLEDIVIGRVGVQFELENFPNYFMGRGAYVLFGNRATTPVSLAAPSQGAGFFIRDDGDPETYDSLGRSVVGAGDVNGDGLDDILITSFTRSFSEPGFEGAVYVVFGKTDGADVDSTAVLSGQGGGFVIRGSAQNVLAGITATGAGDVNGDGLADVLVSALSRGTGSSSSVYVVFGKVDNASVGLDEIEGGTGPGIALLEDAVEEDWVDSVAGLGDVNGDGLADVAFGGSYLPTPDGSANLGRTRVLFGRREAARLSLADLDANPSLGYSITGANAPDRATLVERVGDVNGDGLDDVLVAAPEAVNEELGLPAEVADAGVAERPDGIAYVLFGRSSASSNIALSDIERGSADGFAISGFSTNVALGVTTSGGDIDADGLADVIMGALLAPTQAEAYAVLGNAEPSTVRIGPAPANQVLTIEGNFSERSGVVVASGADFNGDGFDDMLFGASTYGGSTAGGAYVALGWDVRGTSSGRGDAMIGDKNDNVFDLPALPPLLVRGGHGSDTLRAGSQTPVVDLRARGRWESIEVIDVRGGGAHRVLLDEVALRRIPENQQGFAFSLARRLTVLGDAEDTLELEASGFLPRGGNAGRTVYGKAGVYYGLEVSPEMTFVPGATPR